MQQQLLQPCRGFILRGSSAAMLPLLMTIITLSTSFFLNLKWLKLDDPLKHYNSKWVEKGSHSELVQNRLAAEWGFRYQVLSSYQLTFGWLIASQVASSLRTDLQWFCCGECATCHVQWVIARRENCDLILLGSFNPGSTSLPHLFPSFYAHLASVYSQMVGAPSHFKKKKKSSMDPPGVPTCARWTPPTEPHPISPRAKESAFKTEVQGRGEPSVTASNRYENVASLGEKREGKRLVV